MNTLQSKQMNHNNSKHIQLGHQLFNYKFLKYDESKKYDRRKQY